MFSQIRDFNLRTLISPHSRWILPFLFLYISASCILNVFCDTAFYFNVAFFHEVFFHISDAFLKFYVTYDFFYFWKKKLFVIIDEEIELFDVNFNVVKVVCVMGDVISKIAENNYTNCFLKITLYPAP